MKTLLKKFLLALVGLCVFLPGIAHAGGSIGVGVGFMSSEYKKTDGVVLPIPAINYESERFYVRGLTGGFNLYKDETHELSLTLSYLPQYFKASRSDSWRMRQLDDRHSTALAGAAYMLKTQYGTAKIAVGGDILDHGGGFVGDVSYSYPFHMGAVTVAPIGGLTWSSKDYNDYYYGVSGKESRKSGLKKYAPDDAFSPFVGVDSRLKMAENWDVFMNMRAVFLSDEIADSPMVDDKVKWVLSTGVSYRF